MTSAEKPKNKSGLLSFIFLFSLLLIVGSAVGSLDFMFSAGQRQKSIMLIAMFTGWVALPFVALLVVHIASRNWTTLWRVLLFIITLIITLGSIACYSHLPDTKPAAVFLIVPLASLTITAMLILAIRIQTQKK